MKNVVVENLRNKFKNFFNHTPANLESMVEKALTILWEKKGWLGINLFLSLRSEIGYEGDKGFYLCLWYPTGRDTRFSCYVWENGEVLFKDLEKF